MDFFRHWYSTQDEWINEAYPDLSNMGFVYADGTSLLDPSRPTDHYDWIKWRFEPSSDTTSAGWDTRYGYTYMTPLYGSSIPILTNKNYGGLQFPATHSFYGHPDNTTTGKVIFFIPLKNKGFLYKTSDADTNLTIQPFRKYQEPEHVTGINIWRGWAAWIGFQSNVSNLTPYSYLAISSLSAIQRNSNNSNFQRYEDLTTLPVSWYHSTKTSNTPKYDYHKLWIDGITRHIPFLDGANCYSDFTYPNNPAQSCWWKPMLTVDVNQNVCTLMHVPYDNTYLDNIYLLVTAPQEDMDNKFFSFSGRNFLNVMGNIVVELPAN